VCACYIPGERSLFVSPPFSFTAGAFAWVFVDHEPLLRKASHQGRMTMRANRKPHKRLVLGLCATSGTRLSNAPRINPLANPPKWAMTSDSGDNASRTNSITPPPMPERMNFIA